MSLTEHDRFIIDTARRLAAMTADEICIEDGHPDFTGAYAFGRVKPLLTELADIAERLAG